MGDGGLTRRVCSALLHQFVHSGVRNLLIALVLVAVSGCATTKPWQREHLSKRVMAPDPDEDQAALRSHLIGVREGAVGGAGGGGGGCGCN